MADVNSDVIANMVAVPSVSNDPTYNGRRCQAMGIAAPAADQADDSLIRMVRVPSNCRIEDVRIAAADATTAGKVDLGVYYPAHVNAGAVIDRDALAAAFDLSGGPFYYSSMLLVGVVTIAESAKPLWEVAGLSSDPGGDLDIVLTVETLFNGGPTSIGLKVDYVV